MRSRDAEAKRRGSHGRRSILPSLPTYFLLFSFISDSNEKIPNEIQKRFDAGGSFCIFLYSHILSRSLSTRAIALLYISIIVAHCSCVLPRFTDHDLVYDPFPQNFCSIRRMYSTCCYDDAAPVDHTWKTSRDSLVTLIKNLWCPVLLVAVKG